MGAKKKSQKDGERSFLNKSYKVNIKKISLLILGKRKIEGIPGGEREGRRNEVHFYSFENFASSNLLKIGTRILTRSPGQFK